MIRVKFLSKNNDIVYMESKGHAGFDEYGKDIVCSATSVLCLAILNGITEVLHISPDFSVDDDGFVSIDIRDLPISEVSSCQVLMKTLLLGLQNIEISYSDYINVIIEEVE